MHSRPINIQPNLRMITHSTFPVRTFHCDAFGHVNNARYLEFLEEGRWQFSEKIGLTSLLRARDVGFIIMDMRLQFRRPVFEGETITVQTSLVSLGSASGEVKQWAFKEGESKPSLKAMFHFILIDRLNENRSIAIEGEIRDCLDRIIES